MKQEFSLAGVSLVWMATLGMVLHFAQSTEAEEIRFQPTGVPMIYKQVDGRDLKAHVVFPPDWKPSDRRPAVVFFHGGGWRGGTPYQFSFQANHLAARGMVCLLIEYRFLPKGETRNWPVVCIHDARSAMRWVRSQGDKLGVDTNRIAAAGGSAGGHLAAFVGLVNSGDDPHDDLRFSCKANALALFNPAVDLGPKEGAEAGETRQNFRDYSPAHHVRADAPPTIIFSGTEDQLIPVSVLKRFQKSMHDAGARCDIEWAEGQPHSFFNRPPWNHKTLKSMDDFFVSLNWIEAAPVPPNVP